MKALIILLLLTSAAAAAQHNHLAQFAVWKPAVAQNFEEGYKQHLRWHQSNKDPWRWYGWFIVSGPRYGQFVDATFDHSWRDFDQAISPSEDRNDNLLHVVPPGNYRPYLKSLICPSIAWLRRLVCAQNTCG